MEESVSPETRDSASDQPPTSAAQRLLSADGFVWGIWLAMAVVLFVFVAQYGSNVPQWDEWHYVAWLTGERLTAWGEYY